MKNSSCKVPSKRTKSNISQGKTLKDYFTREVKGRVFSTVNSTAQATEQSAVYSDYDSASQAVLCPICQMNLTVYRIEERTAHVNNCLGDHLIDGMANDLGTRQNITSTSIVNEGSKVVESKKDFINVDYNTTRGAGDQKDFAITEDLTINEPVTRKDFIIKDSNAASTWAKENKKDFAITQNITEKIDVEQRHEVWTFDNDSNLKRTFDSVSSTDELELRSDSRKDSKKASLSFMSSQLEMYNDCKQDPEKASLSSMNNHLQVRKPFEHTSNLRSKDNNLSITPETKRTARTAPFYKIINLNSGKHLVAVDAFSYGPIQGVSDYFLTHFHSDHYGGLSKSWKAGYIFCTEATGNLLQLHLNINPHFIRTCALNSWIQLDGYKVFFIDANHCPGSAIILFTCEAKSILHTGDFRASMTQIDYLSELMKNRGPLDVIYLDTTYLDPSYCFPSQGDVISSCTDYVGYLKDNGTVPSTKLTLRNFNFFTTAKESKKANPLVFVGTYTIGKERLAIGIAKRLQSKIFASTRKIKTLRALGDSQLNDLLVDDGLTCNVHLVGMGELKIEVSQLSHRP